MQDSLVEYGARRVIITITAILCALLEIVDSTIVNVALNEMKGNLGATLSEVGWVITAYAIGNVIIVPMTSWLSQQFGRRNYFAASIIIFTVFSFLCGNATNIWELVFFRLMQGIGGGALLVTSQTIITESYPVEKRSMAQAIYGLGVIIGPTLGPPLGGYIVDNFSWPYIFYINIPIGIAATLMTLQFVRSPKYAEKRKISDVDWIGIALLAITVGSLQFILERGHEEDWFASGMIVFFTVAAVLGFILFLWRELTFKYPIVELRVLKNGNLRIGTVMSFVLGFGLYGSTFIVPLYTQSILGWTALQSGALMIPAALTTAFMMPIIGRLLSKGAKQQILVSLGLFIFFIYSFWGYKILTPDTGKDAFFWMLIVRGAGLGLLFIPITSLSLSTLKGQEIGQGAAFTGMMRQLGGSFGIAAITTFIANASQKYRVNLISHLDQTDFAVQQRLQALKGSFIAKGMTPDAAMNAAYKMLDLSVTKQATVLSYMDVFLYLGVIFLVCIPFILFIKERKSKEKIDLSGVH
ncbi:MULTISPECIES: DHA2 family efflux MFS transporter permease subunit [Chryseobacterium]|uniref:DHA2 family efflux MFS transporter permease subunit n=1 Tax=Chryseobacterium gambrini TaxID=373672 RepID=A0A1N7QA40_9FLAO|nr:MULTISPECIES: DHA2 family efflux MFS transporter permease subunit [Chryseobacterium]MBL7879865.1 DHA2 family efflux MFS transporter permease subunit [Chryseobacterium gambrini]PTT73210.1 MFS transporter [Chryseobacterium sp. HMWF001]PVV60739.1 MFS transporter [Chryseobacterium sp. HMWF035]SIT19701.1 MFS transporter, DHA2 family, multidrug resistance protein [Chryseobacterium gambrini]BEV03868.1 DHA2 family efflux MFS transporter permease subunit [Chryseobacterium gambrini]